MTERQTKQTRILLRVPVVITTNRIADRTEQRAIISQAVHACKTAVPSQSSGFGATALGEYQYTYGLSSVVQDSRRTPAAVKRVLKVIASEMDSLSRTLEELDEEYFGNGFTGSIVETQTRARIEGKLDGLQFAYSQLNK